jgi:hypothetical protein
MPTFRRMSAEELGPPIRPRYPKPDLTPYLEFLYDFSSGEFGEITLGEAETQKAIKRRLTIAAKQLNKRIRYKRIRQRGSDDHLIRFEVR